MTSRAYVEEMIRECNVKVRHPDEKSAQAHLRNLKRKPGTMVVYHCRFCKFWHVGHRVRGK